MATTADRAPVSVPRTERFAGVLNDRQAERLEADHVGGIAEDVDGQQRRRARR